MKHIKTFESFLNEFGPLAGSGNFRADQLETIKRDAMKKSESGKTVYVVGGKHGTYKVSNYFEKGNTYAAYYNGMPQVVEGELVNEGQFSWMTQDTDTQIGSERENTITVYMFSDKGERWEEKRYKGYGEFGGKDYYELLAQMNGVENANRQDGIDIAFGKKKVKGKVLFPALVQNPKFNWKRHDFTEEPADDPNQSWYQEPEDDDDYDEYDESIVDKIKKDKK